MSAIPFDTHKFVRRLREAGFDERQAEAVTEAFAEASGETALATKRDLDAAIERVMAEVRLTRWMVATLLGLAIANFAKQFF